MVRDYQAGPDNSKTLTAKNTKSAKMARGNGLELKA
jgi:hypothetical protein